MLAPTPAPLMTEPSSGTPFTARPRKPAIDGGPGSGIKGHTTPKEEESTNSKQIDSKINLLKDDPDAPGGGWKLTPLKVEHEPADMKAWRASAIKDKSIAEAPIVKFNPKDLKVTQIELASGNLKALAAGKRDAENPVVVVRTKEGDFIHDGNHRAALKFLQGAPVNAKVVNLAQDAALLKAAGLIIVTKEGKALFLLRSEEGDHAGEWAFPAGKIEEGEEPEETIIREVREETQWIPENDIHELNNHSSDEDVDFTCFEVQVNNEFIPTLNDEHIGWAWAPLDAPPQPLHPGCQTVLDMALGEGLAQDLLVEDKEEYKTVKVGNEVYMLKHTKRGWVLVKKAPASGSNILHSENLGELFGIEMDAEFKESDHPRGQPDNPGQFVAGSGGTSAQKSKRDLEDEWAKLTTAIKQHMDNGTLSSPEGVELRTRRDAVTKAMQEAAPQTLQKKNKKEDLNLKGIFAEGSKQSKQDIKRWSKATVAPTSSEKKIIKKYVEDDAWEQWNDDLRAGKEVSWQAAELQTWLEKQSFPEDATLYRRDLSVGTRLSKLSPGDTFEEPGFCSTTNVDLAESPDFVGFTIQVKKGAKGTPIDKFTPYPEQEVLLKAGSKFRVVENAGNRLIVELLND